jgi:hypothetical protein
MARREPQHQHLSEPFALQAAAQIPLPCGVLVLGYHIMGVCNHLDRYLETTLMGIIDLSTRPVLHSDDSSTKNSSCRSHPCPTTHRDRKIVVHLSRTSYTAVFHEISYIDDMHQLVVFLHTHTWHDRIPGLAILYYHHTIEAYAALRYWRTQLKMQYQNLLCMKRGDEPWQSAVCWRLWVSQCGQVYLQDSWATRASRARMVTACMAILVWQAYGPKSLLPIWQA